MTNPMIKIVNSETGEEIERVMTQAEFDEYNAGIEQIQSIKSELKSLATAKISLLDKLGITEDEAKLLLA